MDAILAEPAAPAREGRLRLALPASPEGIGDAQPKLRAFLEAHGLPLAKITGIELVFEELVMNVFMHGFDDPAGETVSVAVACDGTSATLVFKDHGRPFDPVATPPRPMNETFDEDRPGGLGLRLIQATATSLAYERLPDGINRVRAFFSA